MLGINCNLWHILTIRFVDFNKLLGAQKYDHFHIVIINMYASKIYMWYTHDTKTSRGHEKDKL